MPDNNKRRGILNLGAGSSSVFQSTGWKILKLCIISFAVLGFLGSFAGMMRGGLSFNGVVIEGWMGVWYTTAIAAISGALFGCIWLVLFKALSLALAIRK